MNVSSSNVWEYDEGETPHYRMSNLRLLSADALEALQEVPGYGPRSTDSVWVDWTMPEYSFPEDPPSSVLPDTEEEVDSSSEEGMEVSSHCDSSDEESLLPPPDTLYKETSKMV